MKPLTIALTGFAAGLIPGLLLYVFSGGGSSGRSVPSATPAGVSAPASALTIPSTPPAVSTSDAPAPAADDKRAGADKSSVQSSKAGNGSKQDSALAASLEQQLRDRTERLATAEAGWHEARSRIGELETKVAALTEQFSQAQASEKGLRQELDASTRQIATLQADLKARTATAADADLAAQTRSLKLSVETAQKAAARTAELANELEDISRRRETYLNQVLSRYREATDLFRAMSLRLDNPRDAGGVMLNNDLSRIQQAVQNAEEDIRQLRALNQGSTRVLKEIAAARAKK
jgi:chromosome segregation ATPase